MQNKKEEALQLASKTITIRKSILDNKGPRVADSMFIVDFEGEWLEYIGEEVAERDH